MNDEIERDRPLDVSKLAGNPLVQGASGRSLPCHHIIAQYNEEIDVTVRIRGLPQARLPNKVTLWG